MFYSDFAFLDSLDLYANELFLEISVNLVGILIYFGID